MRHFITDDNRIYTALIAVAETRQPQSGSPSACCSVWDAYLLHGRENRREQTYIYGEPYLLSPPCLVLKPRSMIPGLSLSVFQLSRKYYVPFGLNAVQQPAKSWLTLLRCATSLGCLPSHSANHFLGRCWGISTLLLPQVSVIYFVPPHG